MSKVKIRCPSCHKIGEIDINEDQIRGGNTLRGIISITLGKNQICNHTLVAYLDLNLALRDCLSMDFQIEIPDIRLKEDFKDKKPKIIEDDDIFLIKQNIIPQLLCFILHGCFLKEKILFIVENDVLTQLINQFLKFIFEDSFVIDVSVISEYEYLKNRKKYENYLIFNETKIIRDKEKVFEKKEKNLKIENNIVHNFYQEIDLKYSLILLRNEIRKAHTLSKTIKDFINTLYNTLLRQLKMRQLKMHHVSTEKASPEYLDRSDRMDQPDFFATT